MNRSSGARIRISPRPVPPSRAHREISGVFPPRFRKELHELPKVLERDPAIAALAAHAFRLFKLHLPLGASSRPDGFVVGLRVSSGQSDCSASNRGVAAIECLVDAPANSGSQQTPPRVRSAGAAETWYVRQAPDTHSTPGLSVSICVAALSTDT